MSATMATEPTAAGGDDKHKYKVISLRPPTDMRDILTRLAREERRTMSQMILLLLEDALEAKGLWPPPPPKGKRG